MTLQAGKPATLPMNSGAVETPSPNVLNCQGEGGQCTASPRASTRDASDSEGSRTAGRMSQSGGGGRRVFWDEGPGDLGP